MNTNIKKILLSSTVIIVFIIYVIHLKSGGEEGTQVIVPRTVAPSTIPVPTATTGVTSSAPTPAPTQASRGKYKDGNYVGDVADAFYGNVQVQALIKGGQITDVQFLQYPNDRQTSIEINSQAMPLLTQEAIQAQSAQVDGVTGATATSGAFIQSLQSALQKAT